MKQRLKKTIYISIFFQLLLIISVQTSITQNVIKIPKTSAYITHGSISFSNGTQIEEFFVGNSSDGETWESAYILEDYNITTNIKDTALFINSTNNYIIIRNCLFSNNYAGIHLLDTSKIRIESCIFIDNEYSLYVQNSANIIVTNNNVTSNKYGIVLDNSSLCTITQNNSTDNSISGIHLASSNNNTITLNNASINHYYGIFVYDSRNNTIRENILYHNAGRCIGIQWKTSGDRTNFINDNECTNAPSNNGTIPGYSNSMIILSLLLGISFILPKIIKKSKKI